MNVNINRNKAGEEHKVVCKISDCRVDGRARHNGRGKVLSERKRMRRSSRIRRYKRSFVTEYDISKTILCVIKWTGAAK